MKPENTKIQVFKAGTLQGSIVSNSIGGHKQPIQITGTNAEWKKAQKKAAKSITSDAIKNKKACFIQCCIIKVCIFNDSLIISLNQQYKL